MMMMTFRLIMITNSIFYLNMKIQNNIDELFSLLLVIEYVQEYRTKQGIQDLDTFYTDMIDRSKELFNQIISL